MLDKPSISISIISIACACTFSLVMAACVTEANYPERAADIACSKLQECSPQAYSEGCEESYEELVSAAIDECDTYRGGLAHRCLNEVEDQSCDEISTPSACEKFNEKCGFDEPQPLGNLEIESYGLGQLRAVQ